MLLVFLSHFVDAYFQAHPARTYPFRTITRVASPAFVWISGITLEGLYARGAKWAQRTRDRLIDRALFLVLVGHPLIAGAYVIRNGGWHDALRIMFITDTLALCLWVGAVWVPRLGVWQRVMLGSGLILTSWGLTVFWNPRLGGWPWRIKDTLVGDCRDHWTAYNFPPVPWLGLFLIATAAGAWFVAARTAGRWRRIRWAAAAVGLVGVLTAQALEKAGRYAAATRATVLHDALAFLTSTEKRPPAPAYFLRYGGLALVLFALVLAAYETNGGRRTFRWMALIGRSSATAFVVQYYVYFVLVVVLPRPSEPWAALYFASTVALIWAFLWTWERLGGNRLVTVGYPALVGRPRTPHRSFVEEPLSGGPTVQP